MLRTHAEHATTKGWRTRKNAACAHTMCAHTPLYRLGQRKVWAAGKAAARGASAAWGAGDEAGPTATGTAREAARHAGAGGDRHGDTVHAQGNRGALTLCA
eukprot:6178121-Pleurochrysis_carterae.AAC.1